ncbi:hypothetical protein ACMGDH_03915 [Sphingomonas sp. DT-207]|uniref:hypothetical protein n=1 Tax=Sphingomonas sp. DT-207 TaxID=3396167 RepID=UPI003F1E2AAB
MAVTPPPDRRTEPPSRSVVAVPDLDRAGTGFAEAAAAIGRALQSVSATALFAALPFNIAERELATARKLLPDWPEDVFAVRQLPDEQGPGNALLLKAVFENATEIVTGFGKLGVR